ncbi:S-4TM family putative pore-forming effector [Rahnella inusitata]|uniref:S-4TM family putative pore-forming effector n=1 Tax=Rahnella inusitata TaxID=58169 RepID=UPI0039AF332A
MNTVFMSQEDEKNIHLQMGARRIYSQFKFINNINFFLSVFMAILIAVFAALIKRYHWYPDYDLAPYLGFYGIAVLVFGLLTGSCISKMKKKAAVLQEMYDCNVLRIPWSELKAGKPLSQDEVFRVSSYHRRKKAYGDFRGWYVKKDYAAPQPLIALLCHGKNIGWDMSQRIVMHRIYLGILIVAVAALVFFGLYMHALLTDFLYYIVFMLPFFRHVIQSSSENRRSMERITRVKEFIEKEIQNLKISGMINEDKLGYIVRSVQDEVFLHRAGSSPAPDILHALMKKRNEEVFDDYFESHLSLINS